MDYKAFLMLEGGDDDVNALVAKYYSHLRNLQEGVIKQAKINLYDAELRIQMAINSLPQRAYDPNKRRELMIELLGEYEDITNMIMNLHIKILNQFMEEEESLFPDTDTEDDDN